MGNRIMRTVLFAASALFSMSAFGAGAARFGTLRNSDWVVTNAWQAVSNKTHDLILEIGHGDSLPPDWQNVSNAAMNAVQSLQPAYDYTDNALISFSSTGSIFRSLSYGTPNRWTDATGCVWEVSFGAWSVTHSPPLRENDFFDGPEWFNDDSIAGDHFVGPGWYIWSLSLTYERISDDLNFNSYTCEWDGDGVNYVTVCIRPALTNFVGRVALTNDISQAISTNNSAFVSAVLAAPLVGADPNDLSEIAEYGSYGTVGAAILALIAGLAALKRGKLDGAAAYPAWEIDTHHHVGDIVSYQGGLYKCIEEGYYILPTNREAWEPVTIDLLKQDALSPAQIGYINAVPGKANASDVATALAQKANATDLPYALVTPGEWEFSGLPSGYEVTSFQWIDVDGDDTGWEYEISDIGGGSFVGVVAGTETDLSVTVSISLIGVTFTATRASLPGHLLDRAVNAVSVSDTTTLTLPALVNAGKARDFLVRLSISGSTVPTITFAAPTGETITYETDGDEFPVPDAEGTWLYSFTETAAGVFAVALKSVSVVTQGGV